MREVLDARLLLIVLTLVITAPFLVYGESEVSKPSCTLNAEPSVVQPNQHLVLEWETKRANTGYLFGTAISPVEEGSRTFGGFSSEGARSVTLFVNGEGGSGQCSARIEVKIPSDVPSALTVRLPDEGVYQTGDDIDISWEYPNASASTRVYLTLTDLNNQSVSSSSIATDLTPTSGYTWEVSTKLGSTTIKSGEYRIRAVAYTDTHEELASAQSAIIILDTGITGTVVHNIATALAALESALMTLLAFLSE